MKVKHIVLLLCVCPVDAKRSFPSYKLRRSYV